MKFDYEIIECKFIERPNRFIAVVEIDGVLERAHVPNTGRMKELLYDGVRVGVSFHDSETRKTKYELRLVEKNGKWISIDSQLPNKLMIEYAQSGALKKYFDYDEVKWEKKYKNSRFDLQLEMDDKKTFVEIKGVTLERDNWAFFPDAPTSRGKKHVLELIDATENGYACGIVFLVQMESVNGFTPNWITDPEFSRALVKAEEAGVKLVCLKCHVSTDGVEITDQLKIVLNEE